MPYKKKSKSKQEANLSQLHTHTHFSPSPGFTRFSPSPTHNFPHHLHTVLPITYTHFSPSPTHALLPITHTHTHFRHHTHTCIPLHSPKIILISSSVCFHLYKRLFSSYAIQFRLRRIFRPTYA